MFSLSSALQDFGKDPDWVLKTTIGGFINYAALALFVINPALTPISFFLMGLSTGYILRSARSAMRGELDKLPAWNEILDLIISGLSWLSISAGFYFFSLSCLIISLIAAAAVDIHQVQNPNSLIWAQSTFQFLYWLIAGQNFFLAVLVLNFAEEERMAAGFAWRKTLRRIFKAPLLLGTTWLAGSALTALALIVPTASVIGAVLTPFCFFLAQIITSRLMGQAWAYLNELEKLPPAKA